jgi:hypothetical protein
MPITACVPTSVGAELFAGTHTAADTYKIALYTSAATLGESTTVYTTTNEVVGTGYTAGGATLVGYTPGTAGTEAWIDWTTDPTWASSTITARGAMIYNSSKSNKVLAILDFGADITSTASTFTVTLPATGAGTAVIRAV